MSADTDTKQTDWVPIFGAVISALTLILNIHQSWKMKHLEVSCKKNGMDCCEFIIESSDQQDPVDHSTS